MWFSVISSLDGSTKISFIFRINSCNFDPNFWKPFFFVRIEWLFDYILKLNAILSGCLGTKNRFPAGSDWIYSAYFQHHSIYSSIMHFCHFLSEFVSISRHFINISRHLLNNWTPLLSLKVDTANHSWFIWFDFIIWRESKLINRLELGTDDIFPSEIEKYPFSHFSFGTFQNIPSNIRLFQPLHFDSTDLHDLHGMLHISVRQRKTFAAAQ